MDGEGTPPAATGVRFGALERVEIRTCWPDEARHFTPWLATPEAIHLLASTIGMELAVEGNEVPVGPFCADILARDLTSDELVVIENQLDRTNHDHLGKMLTYAAVLGAGSVIWIARSFTEEHRKTIEWLNERTTEDLQLYGVELQVWRIGASLPAPRFEVVCRPNEVVRQANEKARADEFSPTRQLQQEFWQPVRQALATTGRFSSLQSARPQYWFNVALGRANIHLSLTADTWGKQVGVKVYLGHEVAEQVLRELLPQQAQIDQEIGAPLEWNPNPEKMDKTIRLVRPGDVTDRAQWPELVQWLARTTVAFHRAFAPRVASLRLTRFVAGGDPENNIPADEAEAIPNGSSASSGLAEALTDAHTSP